MTRVKHGKGNRVFRLLVAVLFLTMSHVTLAVPADAVTCGAGKHIFVRNGLSSPNPRWGIRGRVKIPSNQLDQSCDSAMFASIHLDNCSTVCYDMVETGIKMFGFSVVVWTEQEQSGQIIHNDNITTAATGIYTTYRLKEAQDGSVFFEYNFGSGFVTTWSSPYNVIWGSAYPMGESEKKGDQTQMEAHFRNLQYLTSTWSEVNWPSMTCVVDEAPGWTWSPVSGSTNAFDVVNVGGNSCAPA
jgi:hypothetical protein